MNNKNFQVNELGPMPLDSLVGFDAFRGVLQDIFPMNVLSRYSTVELLGMATQFCRSVEHHAPAICFSVPEAGENIALLRQLPNRLILDLGTRTRDSEGIFAEWKRQLLGEVEVMPQSVVPDNLNPPTAGNRVSFYPPTIVPYLGHFCVIERWDGSICPDFLVFNSVFCGQRVLHGLVDMHIWSQVRGFARLPEAYADQEAHKLNLYDKRGRMEPIFNLFAPFRGQTVAVKITTLPHQTRDYYGDIHPRETPSGIFEIGDIETTYDRVVFMAQAQEVDALIQRESK